MRSVRKGPDLRGQQSQPSSALVTPTLNYRILFPGIFWLWQFLLPSVSRCPASPRSVRTWETEEGGGMPRVPLRHHSCAWLFHDKIFFSCKESKLAAFSVPVLNNRWCKNIIRQHFWGCGWPDNWTLHWTNHSCHHCHYSCLAPRVQISTDNGLPTYYGAAGVGGITAPGYSHRQLTKTRAKHRSSLKSCWHIWSWVIRCKNFIGMHNWIALCQHKPPLVY